jgi:signal transduction histidine kinase
MPGPFVSFENTLTPEDLSSLQEVAEVLWKDRHAVAVEWSRLLTERLPEYFAADAAVLEPLIDLNEAFLSLVLGHMQRREIQQLFQIYYQSNRQLIEADLQQAPALRISLSSLYTSARVSLQVINEHLARVDSRLIVAYTKLTAELMMIVGQAYSDAREDYLQRAFEQVNTLSHELRAPLAHLFGYLELLHAGDYGPVSPKQEEVLSQLIHETDDLLWVLTGTLDLSRLDTGRVDVRVEEFPLAAVMTEVVNSTPHPNIPVTCSIPPDLPPLRTDRVKVKQIVGNLLRNAVRYGGHGQVTLASTVPQPGYLEVSVHDHGPGIKPEELAIIFEFLERGQNSGLARDGYGIGLHVVRRLVGLLGGTITVDSRPGEGSTFRFTIPINAPQAEPAKS